METKVFDVDGPFNPDDICRGLEEALESLRIDRNTKTCFVLVDNLMALIPYLNITDIIALGTRLQGIIGKRHLGFIGLSKTGSKYYEKIYREFETHSDFTALMHTLDGRTLVV